jgi:hypothetical protein
MTLCRQCYNLPHRRPRRGTCVCGHRWGPDVYEIPIPSLRSVAGDIVVPDEVVPAPTGTRENRVATIMSDGGWRAADTIRKAARIGAGAIRRVLDGMVESGHLDVRTVDLPWRRVPTRQYRLV